MPKWPVLLIIVVPAVIALIMRWLDNTEDERHINRMADESRRKMIRMRRREGIQ